MAAFVVLLYIKKCNQNVCPIPVHCLCLHMCMGRGNCISRISIDAALQLHAIAWRQYIKQINHQRKLEYRFYMLRICNLLQAGPPWIETEIARFWSILIITVLHLVHWTKRTSTMATNINTDLRQLQERRSERKYLLVTRKFYKNKWIQKYRKTRFKKGTTQIAQVRNSINEGFAKQQQLVLSATVVACRLSSSAKIASDMAKLDLTWNSFSTLHPWTRVPP